MKQFFVKIAAILMTFVVLFSTMSFTISEHYCGNTLMNASLFSKAESCEMDTEMTAASKDCIVVAEDCCKDIIKQIEGQNELKSDLLNLNLEQQVFVASFIYSYINLFEGLENNIIPFKNYSPPLIDKDIHILYQTFLI
ncbi:MAG: hypothetical protein QM495_08800 [Lutibacter sp.]|uniref:HYC_CC_PP family protein n=1 Tax=Lutibacter sp. TaxID=1925666 RepID=UPI003859881C